MAGHVTLRKNWLELLAAVALTLAALATSTRADADSVPAADRPPVSSTPSG